MKKRIIPILLALVTVLSLAFFTALTVSADTVCYTVDFSYNGNTAKVDGDTKNYGMEAVFSELEIGEKIVDVKVCDQNGGFFDGNAVKNADGDVLFTIVQSGDGWMLNVFRSFTDEFTMKAFSENKTYEILVTDPVQDPAYTITYETNGGSTVANAYGMKIVFPAEDPTKDGAIFDGWYTDSTLKTKAVAGTEMTANTTLYAKWLEAVCKIGSVKYASVSAALESIADNTATTIILVANAKDNIRIPQNRTITLDLNGYALTSENNTVSVIYNLGTLTIVDSNTTSQIHYFTYVKDGAWVYLPNYTAVGGEVKFENIATADLTSGTTVISVSGGVVTRMGENEQFAGIYNDDGAKLTLENVNVIGNKTQHSAIYNVHAELIVNKAHVLGNTSYSGAGIKNYNGTATVGTANGSNADVVIAYNTTTTNGNLGDGGGAVYNVLATRESAAGEESSAALTIHHATITHNKSAYKGGGISNAVYKAGVASVVVNDAAISHNESVHNGGGIANYTHNANGQSIVSVKKGLITENKAITRAYAQTTASGGNGGGIASNGTLVISGEDVTVSANEAAIGGGIYNDGTLSLEKGTVDGNKAKVVNPAPYAAYEGLVGGVYNDANGVFLMSGGSVINNHAESKVGGVLNQGAFAMIGGSVTGNTADTANGVGGVAQLGTMAVGGTAVIKNNKENTNVNSNLMTASPICVGAMTVANVGTIPALTTGAEIGITFASGFNAANYSFTKSEGKFVDNASADTYAKYFVSDSDVYGILTAKNSGSTTYAYSVAKKYSITYNTNGGSTVANAYGMKIVFPAEDPTKDGAVFDGWYTDSTLKTKAVAGTEMTANTTLYAKWRLNLIKAQPSKVNDYSVIVNEEYKVDDGSNLSYAWYLQTVTDVSFAQAGTMNPKVTINTMFTTGVFGDSSIASSNKTISFQVTNFLGGTLTMKFKSTCDIPNMEKDDDDFYTVSDSMSLTFSKTLDEEWTMSDISFTVTVSSTVSSGAGITLPLGKTSFDNGGYYCVVTDSKTGMTETSAIIHPKKVTFTGKPGYDGSVPADMYMFEGRSVTLPANPFTADGGTFAGWSDGETKYSAGGSYTVSGDTTLTANLEHTCHNLVFDTVLCEETMTYNQGYERYDLPSGNYYLASDLTLTANVLLTADTAICLNGHVLNLNGHSIDGWSCDLILVDCQVNDDHTHYFKVDEESGLWALSDALDYDKTVNGGVITGGASTENLAMSVHYLLAEDVNFIGNGTLDTEKGGAVHVVTASIRRCRFFGNVAENGGAVYADYELALYATEFRDNRAASDGGAVYSVGKARIEKCTLKNNQAGKKGGAVLFACTSSGNGALTVLNTVISDNKAGVTGGGIAFNKAGCFAEGTKITMADGSEKNIEEIKVGDLVKTFNHETGTFVSGKVTYVYEGSTPENYFTLSFVSGKTLNIFDCHDLFEKTANRYVTVNEWNASELIGHEFYNAADGVWETLESVTSSAGVANYYSIYVFDTQNCLANGMLSVPDDVDFIPNVYDFDPDTLKANEETLAADLEKYGAVSYEECTLCDSREMYDDANLQYKNLYIGKGLITAFDLNEFYYSIHGVDEFTKGIEGFAVILGKNAVIKNNKVGEAESNIALDNKAMIYVIDGAEGVEAGVSLSDTVGDFAKNVYTNDASKIAFTSDVAGLTQFKTASKTTPVTYTYSLAYIKEQPAKDNDYTVSVDDALTGVTYQWYQYVDGENDVALTGETNAKLGSTVLANASYYCQLSKGGEVIAESESVTPVSVSFAGGTDAVGTAPTTLYQLEGRKITLPANPFTKTGYKFDKWGTYAAGTSYTVGSQNATLTAAWTEKATLTIDVTAQESEIGASLAPYSVKCAEKVGGFTVSYRKYTAQEWLTVAPSEIGKYQVRIQRDEDDTYKAVDSDAGSYSVYYVVTFSNAGAASGTAPNPIKSTVGLADFNPETSTLVSENTLAKEGFVQDGWLAEREGKLVKWETRGTSTSVVLFPCWKPVVNTLKKSNDFGVTLSGTDISYQWYAYTAVAFDAIDSNNFAFVYGTYDAQAKTITSTGDGGVQFIVIQLDPEFASDASYLSCKFACEGETDYYDYDSNYLTPDASGLYRVNVMEIDGDLYLYVLSWAPFTASDLTLCIPTAVSGETGYKIATVSDADLICKVSFVNRVGELTYVTSTLSNTVTPVKVSFAGGTGATGTAPTPLYQLEGRKLTLPSNPFTKTGYKFDKWETYAAGSDYTVGAADVTLTAAWTPKTAVTIDETAQSLPYNGGARSFAIKGAHKDIGSFTVSYFVGGVWTVSAPTAIGSYNVKVERAEDADYVSYAKEIANGLTVTKDQALLLEMSVVGWVYGDSAILPTAETYLGVAKTYYALDDGNEIFTETVPTEAGNYLVKFIIEGTDTYYGDEDTLPLCIRKKEVAEPTVSGSYKYTGEAQTVTLAGVEAFMSTADSFTATEVGIYSVTYALDDNHEWAEGSDGTVTWEIKATELSPKDETAPAGEKKQTVIVETDEGFSSDIEVVVEVTVETSVAEQIKNNNTIVDYYHITDEEAKLARDEQIGVVFNVKLLRTVNGVTSEIQPEDIAEGAKIRVKMLVPADVDVNKVTRILHVHAANDIEVIEFNPERIDENGYYEIEIDRLSEFAFVYERDFTHWIALALLALFLGFVAVLWFALKIRNFKTEEKLHLAPVVGFAVHFVAIAVLTFFAYCTLCALLLGANALALALAIWLYLISKKEKEAPLSFPKDGDAFEKEELSLKDAIACATSVGATAVNKKSVAEYLQDRFGDSVEVNCRKNYISSGILPLADTHYKMMEGGKKCFLYVYELTGGKTFFLARANRRLAEDIAKEHPSFVRSAYPKNQEHDWYTVLLDGSFRTPEEVYSLIAKLFTSFGSED